MSTSYQPHNRQGAGFASFIAGHNGFLKIGGHLRYAAVHGASFSLV
jgi:hypothetical protein